MNKFYREINAKTNGKYSAFRFPSVKVRGDFAEIAVVCAESDRAFAEANIAELLRLSTEICAFHAPVHIVVGTSAPDRNTLRDAVSAFIGKFPFAAALANDFTVSDDDGLCVTLKMHDGMLALAQAEFLPRLTEFFANNYIQPISVNVEKSELPRSIDPYGAPLTVTQKEYAVKSVVSVSGNVDIATATSAAAVTGDGYDTAVCGVLTMLTEFTSKGGRAYQKFVLYDGESTVQCSYFGAPALTRDLVNSVVCVVGNTQTASDRAGEVTMKVFSVARCTADGLNVFAPPAPVKAYGTVLPKPYEEYVQTSIFEKGGEIPDVLRGSFVAFDFETTGLSVAYDRPTEIGAVKITDGVITETFSTLIDPLMAIPDVVSQKTGITDDMVKGKPRLREVLGDFYKFSYGCPLIGHNIAFDFPFLLKYGNRYGTVFGAHATFDTMGIAPRAIPGIEQLSLNRVLEHLGLVNDNAHRALSDATATAKAFIAMQRRLAGVGAR